jgi:transposase-like protein
MNIAHIGNAILRLAIRQNLVSFPAQVPAFMKQRQSGDTQERIVQLYFVRGWPIRSICDRYRISKAMVQKMLSEWRIRAIAGGYIQDIHPEGVDTLAAELEVRHRESLVGLVNPQIYAGQIRPEMTGAELAELAELTEGVVDPSEISWPILPVPSRSDSPVSVAGGR